MDELTRFARQLVERMGARAEGVHRPVSIAEVRKTVLPYRAQRRALGLDSVEDYETVLLRLIAEERGYVRTVPPAAAARCREELAQPNPDLGVLDEIAESTIQVTSMAAAKIVADEETRPATPEPSPRRPEPRDESPPSPSPEPRMSSAASAPPAGECRHCHKPTPSGRQVVFCPWCGERLIPFTCSRCGTELESAWGHCITCGAPVQDPFRFG